MWTSLPKAKVSLRGVQTLNCFKAAKPVICPHAILLARRCSVRCIRPLIMEPCSVPPALVSMRMDFLFLRFPLRLMMWRVQAMPLTSRPTSLRTAGILPWSGLSMGFRPIQFGLQRLRPRPLQDLFGKASQFPVSTRSKRRWCLILTRRGFPTTGVLIPWPTRLRLFRCRSLKRRRLGRVATN